MSMPINSALSHVYCFGMEFFLNALSFTMSIILYNECYLNVKCNAYKN